MRAVLSVLLLLPLIQSATAQEPRRSTFVAVVTDAKTGAPLRDAEVVLPQLRKLARTDSSGHARLAGIEPGAYRVRVRHLGYSPVETRIPLRGDSVESVFELEPTAVELAPIRVTVTVAVMRFPGLRDVFDAGGRHRLASTRGNCGAGSARLGRSTAGRSCFSGQPCLIQVFLDDIYLGEEDFDLARTWDLSGIEYYTGASMPARYRVSGSACDVMLLWSKRGDR